MGKSYSSFTEFFQNEAMNIKREVETVSHRDENMANNRLFVWNFEEIDLEEFIEMFTNFQEERVTPSSRQQLSSLLSRKMNSMMREGYNPVECMLYASKIINKKLQSDHEVQTILAEKIRDTYIKQEGDTEAVLKNIIAMWSWVPQIKVVIMAIGMIGDNEELLDLIAQYYMEDVNYRTKVFYAFVQNKTPGNLERVLKLIMGLRDTEEDAFLARIFQREIRGFGMEGIRMIEKYYENPAMSRSGSKILKKIMLKAGHTGVGRDDGMYRSTLAKRSERDDAAYQDFIQDCREQGDETAFFLCRFSRSDAGGYLKEVLEQGTLSANERTTALVSMGILGSKGYPLARAVIDKAEGKGEEDYAAMVAKIFLADEQACQKMVDTFCTKKDYELAGLYRILRAANISNYQSRIIGLKQEIRDRFKNLVAHQDYAQLTCLTSNFQMFWENKLYSFLDLDTIRQMCEVLEAYAKNSNKMPEIIIISMIETLMNSYSKELEEALFALYKYSSNRRIQELSFKKLKSREIQAPK